MSVPSYKREESRMQYVDTAIDLEMYTIKHCTKFPKRYMFLLTQEITQLSRAICNDAKAANSMYPLNATEREMRLSYLARGICDAECLATQLTIAKELITYFESGTGQEAQKKPINDNVWVCWAELVSEELRLLRGVRKSLNEEYKKLAKTNS